MTSPPRGTGETLVLLRHGLSVWNALNLSTGWVDVGLANEGEAEARRAGELLEEAELLPDVVHTSVLRRAILTAHMTLDAADRLWIPVRRSWRLNERHYGALQGRNKQETAAQFGAERLRQWRRSYDVAPPPLPDASGWSQVGDPAYRDLPDGLVPRTESLRDVSSRLLPYWRDVIVPDLVAGKTVLVVAHGNSLRALVKHLDDITVDDIASVDIPTGIPLVYRLDENLRPTTPGGVYLDPVAAAERIEAVRGQGR